MTAEHDTLAFVDTVDEQHDNGNANGDDLWLVDNTGFYKYCRGAADDAENIIVNQFSTFAIGAALDLAGGAHGQAIQDLLDRKFIEKGLVVNLTDRRNEATKQRDDLSHIAGNLLCREAWQGIEAWQQQHAPEGFSLIMHRPVGPLQYLPTEFYTGAMHWLLDRTRPGGILLAQIPERLKLNRDGCQTVRKNLTDRPDITAIIMPPPARERLPCVLTVKAQ